MLITEGPAEWQPNTPLLQEVAGDTSILLFYVSTVVFSICSSHKYWQIIYWSKTKMIPPDHGFSTRMPRTYSRLKFSRIPESSKMTNRVSRNRATAMRRRCLVMSARMSTRVSLRDAAARPASGYPAVRHACGSSPGAGRRYPESGEGCRIGASKANAP